MAVAHFHFAYIQGVVSFKIIIETLFSFVEDSKNCPFSNKYLTVTATVQKQLNQVHAIQNRFLCC